MCDGRRSNETAEIFSFRSFRQSPMCFIVIGDCYQHFAGYSLSIADCSQNVCRMIANISAFTPQNVVYITPFSPIIARSQVADMSHYGVTSALVFYLLSLERAICSHCLLWLLFSFIVGVGYCSVEDWVVLTAVSTFLFLMIIKCPGSHHKYIFRFLVSAWQIIISLSIG